MKHHTALMVSVIFGIACLIGLSTSASAVSCTEQGRKCASTFAVGANAKYKGACLGEISACKARCKAGEKYFKGVTVGLQYPIDSCS